MLATGESGMIFVALVTILVEGVGACCVVITLMMYPFSDSDPVGRMPQPACTSTLVWREFCGRSSSFSSPARSGGTISFHHDVAWMIPLGAS
jgi:hypothetical protein